MLHKMDMPPEGAPIEVGVMSFDRWTSSYRDTYNDIFVSRRFGRKTWEVTERGPGNRTILHSRHRRLEIALAAANRVHRRLGVAA